jgi:DNA mismatch repair protein MutS
MYNDLLNESFIKLEFNDRDGYFFTCTKIRFSVLRGKLSDEQNKDIKMRYSSTTSNMVKFYTDALVEISSKIEVQQRLLFENLNREYDTILTKMYKKYATLFEQCKTFIEIVDIVSSNYTCAMKYNYTCPEIDDVAEGSSYINITGIRHPIIEATGKEYIQNDLVLSNNTPGLLLYGLNSSGKTSLLRAIGIIIVMAQCGLYVPCKKLIYYPFDYVISQVDLSDDIFSNKSSFVKEMLGLKKILTISGKNTLVLSDELCKGTEMYSATSIVASTIKTLSETKTKFIFTTHLHSLTSPPMQNMNYPIIIKHLDVTINDKSHIIFNRKLQDGPGSNLYGLEVCKNIISNVDFIDYAFNVRNSLTNNNNQILAIKKRSKYNTHKIMTNCEICKSESNLETHHIFFQSEANERGFLKKGIHKNHLSNLCVLCKNCHDLVTYNKITIYGYIDTSNGKILNYNKN